MTKRLVVISISCCEHYYYYICALQLWKQTSKYLRCSSMNVHPSVRLCAMLIQQSLAHSQVTK